MPETITAPQTADRTVMPLWEGLFLEPAYLDGPYSRDDEDDESGQ
jgi:hypothetical protein